MGRKDFRVFPQQIFPVTTSKREISNVVFLPHHETASTDRDAFDQSSHLIEARYDRTTSLNARGIATVA